MICPICSSDMAMRSSRFGKFWGCTNFPACKKTVKCTGQAVYKAVQPIKSISLNFTPTGEQINIWDELVNGQGHIVVQAYAGTGKSTTCQHGMFKLPPTLTIFYGCFGKKNVEEMKQKGFPSNATISTLNSLGGRAVRNAFPKSQLNNYKTLNIMDTLYPEPATKEKQAERRTHIHVVKSLVERCKGYLIDGNNVNELAELCIKHDIDCDEITADICFPYVAKVLEISRTDTSTHDYNDQLWLPVVLNLPCQKFDIVMVDEAQDMNTCQHNLILKHMHTNSRCVIIGDDFQAIYGFRGADSDSMANMATALATTGKPVVTLPLSISQRCPIKVIQYVNQWVEGIKPTATAAPGEILEVNSKAAFDLYQPGDMVLCRVNAPLAGIAYKLIKKGIPAVVLGKDIADGLINLIERLSHNDDEIGNLLVKLESYVNKELEKVRGTRRENSVAERLHDQQDCIFALATDHDSVKSLIAQIRAVFADEANGQPAGTVTLSSIHKAKGLENKRVFWYNHEYTCKSEQENNLKYVAGTRSKDKLYLVTPIAA